MSRFSCAVKIFVGTKSSCYTEEKIEQTTKGLQTNNVDKIVCVNCWKSNASKQFRTEHSAKIFRSFGLIQRLTREVRPSKHLEVIFNVSDLD